MNKNAKEVLDALGVVIQKQDETIFGLQCEVRKHKEIEKHLIAQIRDLESQIATNDFRSFLPMGNPIEYRLKEDYERIVAQEAERKADERVYKSWSEKADKEAFETFKEHILSQNKAQYKAIRSRLYSIEKSLNLK